MSDASLGQMLAEWIESVRVESLPADVVRGCADTVIDTVGPVSYTHLTLPTILLV